MYIHSDMWQPIYFQIVVHSCLPTYNGYVQNRRKNVIDELIFIRMRGRESRNITKSIGVNSFVKSLKNVVYKLLHRDVKKLCWNLIAIQLSVTKLLSRNLLTRVMKCIVVHSAISWCFNSCFSNLIWLSRCPRSLRGLVVL